MENATDPVAFAAVLVPLKVAVSWIDVPTVIEDDDSVVLIPGIALVTVSGSDEHTLEVGPVTVYVLSPVYVATK
jgi:hypothetical protein